MAYQTVCNKCNALVEVDDETGSESGHGVPCAGEAPEIGEPEAMVPEVG